MAKDREERIPDAETLIKELRILTGDTGEEQASGTTGQSNRLRAAHSSQPWSTGKRLGTLATCLVLVMAALGVFYAYARTLQNAAVVRRPPAQDVVSSPPLATAAVPAPVSPAPAIGPGTVDRSEVVRALEVLARKSLRDDRLTQPPADNAHYYFSRLLALEPGNVAARRGFKEIAERFVVLAEQAFSKRNYPKAQALITLGLQVDPANEELVQLQAFMDNRERSLWDTFIGLLSS